MVIGAVITLTCRIVPVDSERAYNNSAWFFAQSKYVSWIFAVEVLKTLYGRIALLPIHPALAALGIIAMATALSIPATVQHFALGFDPHRVYGQIVTTGLQGYSRDVLGVVEYLTKQAQPGDVVLADNTLLGPVLALTKCRVPVGYFSSYLVPRNNFARRSSAVAHFWESWRAGRIATELLSEARVSYIVLNRRLDGVPSMLPATLSKVYSNSEGAIFKVKEDNSITQALSGKTEKSLRLDCRD